MKVFVNDSVYENTVTTFLKVYLNNQTIEVVEQINEADFTVVIEPASISAAFFYEDKQYRQCCKIEEGYGLVIPVDEDTKAMKTLVKHAVFNVMKEALDIVLPWGILIGIRPTKIVMKFLKQGLEEQDIIKSLRGDYLIRQDKCKLLLEVAKKEMTIMESGYERYGSKGIQLYIGIPFCPSKCLYCSFTSYDINKYSDYVENYIETLEKELKNFRDKVLYKYKLRTIYIGGGTPTSLNEIQLEHLLELIEKYIDLSEVEEFTVEAGRPDTITKKKLEVLKVHGVDRISINPQTMKEQTLSLIGRQHTVGDIIKTYNMAKEIGFKTINMDLILGLNKETVSDVVHTLDEVIQLNPENITVHTLAIKRASRLKESLNVYDLSRADVIEEMLKVTKEKLMEASQIPYYLYRQKNMLGNFENIGYSKEGYECIYNVEIMEEKTPIYAIGAGGVSKYMNKEKNKIERIENLKNVEQYIERIDEMVDRKIRKFQY